MPQAFAQKYKQQELNFRRHQETARNTRRERRKHKGRGMKNAKPPTGTGRGLGRQSRSAGGGIRSADGGDRQREEGNLVRENPWG